nr:hypothetical protein [uncultured bacterium]
MNHAVQGKGTKCCVSCVECCDPVLIVQVQWQFWEKADFRYDIKNGARRVGGRAIMSPLESNFSPRRTITG